MYVMYVMHVMHVTQALPHDLHEQIGEATILEVGQNVWDTRCTNELKHASELRHSAMQTCTHNQNDCIRWLSTSAS